ncbi:hypothetical protein F5883DRAFT_554515 [Diaporthe sp. PMI_573]|jgi:hypothetical protein|nr:hypothetical protein F5883DRAFT_554515 [Diaporthaceae sp. PMI_573]
MPPRPLHYQLVVGREVFVTEQMDMHLVWTTGRIFLKPIPRFLLEPRFWTEYLSADEDVGSQNTAWECERGLRKRALGFLFSYAALISHESDFLVAKDKHLLPREVNWSGWRAFVEELDTEHIYPDVDPRFYYGELRLGRLNKIYRLSQTPMQQMQMPPPPQGPPMHHIPQRGSPNQDVKWENVDISQMMGGGGM